MYVYATFDRGTTGVGGVAVVDIKRRAVIDTWDYPGVGRTHGVGVLNGQAADARPTIERERPRRPERITEAARRVSVPVIANQTVAIVGDRALPTRIEIMQRMIDPDGLYGVPAALVDQFLLYGEPDEIAERLQAYGDAGAARVVVTFAAGDWHRQAELLANARERVREG